MSGEPQLFRVDPKTQHSDQIEEVDFTQLGLRERQHIQEWIAANPGILGDDLLIIGKEFSDFDRTNERLDLLAVDFTGRLVIIELKRDDTGADAHWQAIKYASYFTRTSADAIVGMAAEYLQESREEAFSRLLKHLNSDDLNALNNDQRIILASHRFAPEVTSAALWLNQKVPGKDLITCVKLTPFRDAQTESLYVQASTIIPVPGIDDYLVGVGQSQQLEIKRGSNSFATNLQKAYDKNKDDEVTHFFRNVGQLAIKGLPDGIRPDRTSRWGGAHGWGGRYYHLWYRHDPWSNWGLSYQIDLHPQEDGLYWWANVYFGYREGIESLLEGIVVHPKQRVESNYIDVDAGTDTLNDEFAGRIAETMQCFIERITPIVEEQATGANEEEA